MGVGKIPWWARPWPSVWWRDTLRVWVPVLGMGGALMFQISATERKLRNELNARLDRIEDRIDSIDERLIRVEALLEAHIADEGRHLPVAPDDPASGE